MGGERKAYFTSELFKFFRELKVHNRREWFQANKDRYEEHVRRPFLAFIQAFAPHLRVITPHLVASARPVGGSLFKIQRDVRFAKDKTPYKTWVSARFYHEQARDPHTPGFYLHLEENDVYAAAGVWHPDTGSLDKIRGAIVRRSQAWRAVVRREEFRRRAQFWGGRLKRPPSGYRADHPLIEDLKWKDFIVFKDFSNDDACSPNLMAKFIETCKLFAPFNKFLANALGMSW